MVVEKTALEKFLGVDSLEVSASARTEDGLLRLDAVQAQAILDMRLQRLTGLEREKILGEYREVLALIADLKDILARPARVAAIIRAELLAVKERFGNPRRTDIQAEAGTLEMEDLIAEEEVVLTISRGGYAKRTTLVDLPRAAPRRQGPHRRRDRRRGRRRAALRRVDPRLPSRLHEQGARPLGEGLRPPRARPSTRGKALVNFLALEEGERVAAMATTRTFPDDRFLIFATKNGTVKKTVLSAYGNPREKGIIAIKLEEGDELLSAQITDGTRKVFLGTRNGMGIKFEETDVRAMGRDTTGVKGIELREGDVLVEMDLVEDSSTLLAVTEKGYGKRTDIAEYRQQGRGGTGVINVKVTEKNGPVVGVSSVTDTDHLLLITEQGILIRIAVSDVRETGRATMGVKLIDLAGGRPRRRGREARGRGRPERRGRASRGGRACGRRPANLLTRQTG